MTRSLVLLATGLALATALPTAASAQRPNPGWETPQKELSGSYPWIDENSHPHGYQSYSYYDRGSGVDYRRGPGFSSGFGAAPGYESYGYRRHWRPYRHW